MLILRTQRSAVHSESLPVKKVANRPRVVIIGGGFGGLFAAKALAGQPVEVTLVDRRNHHTFQPLLYQVALAVLSPAEIASPLRRVLRRAPNVHVLLAEATDFDKTSRKVRLASGRELEYDYLIVAAGARHSYFGHDEWEECAPGLKTVEDAVEIRTRLLKAFESAEKRALLTGQQKSLNFAVVGGGPTGVELAGAIADFARLSLAKDFKAIDTSKSHIRLYEGLDRILNTFSAKSSRRAEDQLGELGVEVHTNSMVTAVECGRIKVGEEWVEADVTLWATGVAASPLGRHLGVVTDRSGRVPVHQDLSIAGHPEIFVIGDMASLIDAAGVRVPGLAAAAMQEGKLAAKNILADLQGRPRQVFKYYDRGTMATIGLHRAVAEFGTFKISGVVAWLLWSLVHVALLIGFRNRVAVMIEWIWAYLTRRGSSPLITEYQQEESTRLPGEGGI